MEESRSKFLFKIKTILEKLIKIDFYAPRDSFLGLWEIIKRKKYVLNKAIK